MRNYIILNNKNSNTISGLIIQELAPISKPLQRTQVETIDGRDGDIVTPLGYAAYNKKIKIGLYGNFDINEVIAYFATKGTVIFSNEPDKYYYYQIVDQIDYERLVRYRVATVTMHVQPFKYSATEGTITVDSSDTVSGEGSDIALDGTAEAPFNVLRHKGNATQKTLSGKNLCSRTTYGTSSVNLFFTPKDTKNYTVSAITNVALDSNSIYLFVDGTNAGKVATISGGANQKASSSFTLSDAIYATLMAGSEAYFQIYKLSAGFTEPQQAQVEEGLTLTPYEEFCGGIPSPNPDYPQDIQVLTGDSTVRVTGKNLFDKNNANVIDGAYINANSAKILQAAGTKVCYIPIAGGRTYTVSKVRSSRFVIGTTHDTPAVNVAVLESASGNSATTELTLTASDDAKYLAVFFYREASDPTITPDAIMATMQIEANNQASSYEPYTGQNYVLPFGDTYLAAIGDYVDEPVKVDGTWYIRRAIGKVDLGTLSWAGSALRTTTGISNIKYVPNNQTLGSGLAEKYRMHVGSGMSGASALNCIAIDVSQVSVNTGSNQINPTGLFYYALATPTDEPITDQDLIDALDELYDQAHSYKGHTHITAIPEGENAPAVLSVEVGEDNESTVTNAGNTTSRPILTIYGQGDIGVYINDVEVLDVALGDEEYITLDSVEMEAYKDTTANLKNRLVTGDYSKLALNAGANKIRFTGKVTKYEISKYSRWL